MTARMEARPAERKRQGQARERGGAAATAAAETRRRRVRAPFSLRCGALLIDYTLIVAIVASATLFARTLGGSISLTGEATLGIGYLFSLAVLVVNFLVLPVFTGTTVGKWATGLRIERQSGEPLGFGRATLRHTFGYLISLLTLGLGFFLAAFDAEGRALHDRIAGTIVVRELGGAARPRMR